MFIQTPPTFTLTRWTHLTTHMEPRGESCLIRANKKHVTSRDRSGRRDEVKLASAACLTACLPVCLRICLPAFCNYDGNVGWYYVDIS